MAEALKALRPGIIRFGGSTTEGFEWTATIGDPARRVPFTTCWGGLEPGNAGLEEFVQLCQWVDAEPLICVRFTGKNTQGRGRAGRVLQRSGHFAHGQTPGRPTGTPSPIGVKYWQIGNELGNETYQKGLADFCKAMKAVDPTHQAPGRVSFARVARPCRAVPRLHLPAPLWLPESRGDGSGRRRHAAR